MTRQDIISKVSKELGLPYDIVDKTYRAYWGFIRNSIRELPLKDDIGEEDFLKLRTSFNIPSLGKLYMTWDRLKRLKKKFNIISEYAKDKEDKATIHQDIGDS